MIENYHSQRRRAYPAEWQRQLREAQQMKRLRIEQIVLVRQENLYGPMMDVTLDTDDIETILVIVALEVSHQYV